MSTDYSVSLVVGYNFNYAQIAKAFLKNQSPAVFDKQTRYDEITGKPKTVNILIKEADDIWAANVNGKLIEGADGPWEFFNELEEEIKCAIITHGGGDEFYAFGVIIPSTGNTDYGRLYVANGYAWDDVAEAGPKLSKLKETLTGLGLKPGKAKVFNVTTIS